MFFVIVYLNHFIRKILFHFSIVDSRIMEDHDMKSTRRATSAKQVRNINIRVANVVADHNDLLTQ